MKKFIPLLLAFAISFTGCGAQKAKVEEAPMEATSYISSESIEETKNSTAADATTSEISTEEITVSLEASSVSSDESDIASSEESSESAKEASTDTTDNATDAAALEKTDAAASEESSVEPQPQTPGYGRILYVGDSRSVDLFDGSTDEIRNEVYDGIPVYCKDACNINYMVDAVDEYGLDNFDTLVSWMGCNDYGNFAKYAPYYELILQNGKQLVLCTVGPTDDNCLDVEDKYYYDNAREIEYNSALIQWAAPRGVKVIDLYSYIESHDSIYIDPNDGIHYQPQPTTELWQIILGNIQ